MAKRKPKFSKFNVPDSFWANLYEMTGSADSHKGYFMVYIDEDGAGQIKYKFDTQATEFAIMRFLEVYQAQYASMQEISFGEEFHADDEEDD